MIIMNVIYKTSPPVGAGWGKINPQCINLQLFLDVMEIVRSATECLLPKKRSGYPYEVFVVYQAFVQLLQRSPEKTSEWLNQACKKAGRSFQNHEKELFSNGKQRRYFPDQPALSRCLKQLESLECTEAFWNQVLLAHLLLLQRTGIIRSEIILIVDYKEEPCRKDETNPYCFGTKEGKTIWKYLCFSIVGNGLHQVIANFKIFKRQDKIPLFEEVLNRLGAHDFLIKYVLFDRGFYRKRILTLLKARELTVIVPGRKNPQTRDMIENYLREEGTRYCKGSMKLEYLKGKGYELLNFNVLLVAKRTHRLDEIKRKYRAKRISFEKASQRIFPLIVLFANSAGISKLRNNETYIRNLYRQRWLIEIAFREMNKLGISSRLQGRDAKLGILGIRAFLYNIWQVQRYLVHKMAPRQKELELDEFLGKTCTNRYYQYIPSLRGEF